MKHFRILLPLLLLALVLSACGSTSLEPYTYSEGGNTVTVDPINQTISNGREVFTYVVEETRSGFRCEITFPDGSVYYQGDAGMGGWSDDFDTDRWLYADFLIVAVKQSQPREKTGNPVAGLLLMGLGALNFFFPELGFFLRYGWAVENAEPSDAYITMAKLGGVLVAVVGLVWCLI